MGEAIKQWRTRMGLTQRAAAQALDIALNTYQELERGARFKDSAPAPLDLRTRLACAAIECKVEPI
jgi:transcriptional regulator with XRE-family HTH domain